MPSTDLRAIRLAVQGPIQVRSAPIVTLDGLRGVAILLVMLHHFTFWHPRAHSTFTRVLYGVFDAGWIGVDLFFVLSGFLITSILIESKMGRHYFSTFFGRRILRIFPLYYGALALFFWGLPRLDVTVPLPDEGAHIWYWLYLTNVDIALHGWAPRTVTHFWSLAVEEHFYLVWPFVVRWFSLRGIGFACAATWILAAALRASMSSHDLGALPIYVLTPTRMDTLTAGAFLAVLAHGPEGLAPWRRAILGAGALAGIVLAAQIYQTGTIDWDVPMWWAQMGLGTVIAVFLVAVVAVALEADRQSVLGRALSASWLRTLGRYSYGIYVFHLAIDEMSRRGVPAWGLPAEQPNTPVGILLAILERTLLSLGAAFVSYHLFERWFLRLKPGGR